MNQLLTALLIGWGSDLLLGDPPRWPHPVVWYGKAIAFCEQRLNKGTHRRLKGAMTAVGLVALVFCLVWGIDRLLGDVSPWAVVAFDAVIVFYCLAGTTLIREVRQVFLALDRSLDDGRRQVARIVGRDTAGLSEQEVRTAALETLAENLSDGVVAPLFWWLLLGVPGMAAYKMVNTLDSMVGYRTERYRDFGCWAARMDDVANYIPARLTALLMVVGYGLLKAWRRLKGCFGRKSSELQVSIYGLLSFVLRNARNHASPNSGYPEAALAGILRCRFGGPHRYFGELFDKPFIGEDDRQLTTADMQTAICINRLAEVLMVAMLVVAKC